MTFVYIYISRSLALSLKFTAIKNKLQRPLPTIPIYNYCLHKMKGLSAVTMKDIPTLLVS